eukprot:scaffold19632_cov29-Prasinocladus_malaysianus.AAC.1
MLSLPDNITTGGNLQALQTNAFLTWFNYNRGCSVLVVWLRRRVPSLELYSAKYYPVGASLYDGCRVAMIVE